MQMGEPHYEYEGDALKVSYFIVLIVGFFICPVFVIFSPIFHGGARK